MKRFITALSLAVFFAAMAPTIADAKRLGGGGMSGMQRSAPARTAPDALPAKPTTPAAAPNAAGAAAAAAPGRSWMGPIAGLAAGLGIAALMSHLGMGAEFGQFLTIALLVLAAFVAFRFLKGRFGQPARQQGLQFAGAAAGGPGMVPMQPSASPSAGMSTGTGATAAAFAPAQAAVPAGFDTASFERIAKMIFIRMQAANDAADLNDLRNFTTPEMFASVKLDLQDRGSSPNQTDVVEIDAQVLEAVEEDARQIVSVRFHGLIREEIGGSAEPFDEVWHLVKPTDGSREWAIAGIQQTA